MTILSFKRNKTTKPTKPPEPPDSIWKEIERELNEKKHLYNLPKHSRYMIVKEFGYFNLFPDTSFSVSYMGFPHVILVNPESGGTRFIAMQALECCKNLLP